MSRSKWNADAEMSMMGFIIPVESREHLLHMVQYCLKTLKSDIYRDDESRSVRAEEIVSNAYQKYNSTKVKSVYHFVVNDSYAGVMMTFVREDKPLTLKNGNPRASGHFSWVENIDAPDCSEAGYTYFQKKNGKIVRIG